MEDGCRWILFWVHLMELADSPGWLSCAACSLHRIDTVGKPLRPGELERVLRRERGRKNAREEGLVAVSL